MHLLTKHRIIAAQDWFERLKMVQDLIEGGFKDGDKGVKIAVLDTGYSGPDHLPPDRRYDRINPGGNCEDNVGHGTDVVGLVLKVATRAEVYVAKVMDSKVVTEETPQLVTDVRWLLF